MRENKCVLESGKRVWFVDDGWANPALLAWLREEGLLVDILGVYMPGKSYEVRIYVYDPGAG